MNLPMAPSSPMASQGPQGDTLSERQIESLKGEVRALALERRAVILAHNYQLPEVQQVADYVGDSLGLSRRAAAAEGEVIVFCGVHFMAAWKREHPDGVVVMYVNTTAEVKALTDYCCTSANAVDVVRHIYETRGEETEILFGPDMWLGAYVERELGRRMHVWDGECHVHAGIRPADIEAVRAAHPGADMLIHPECGCTTSVMEYVATGDISAEGVHMLSTGGMLAYAEDAERRGTPAQAVVATEIGMLYPLQMAAPDVEFIPANAGASCRFMKMITLPKVRDALRDMKFEVRVPEDVAERARIPIDRMVAIG
jgi:quinolinate synthase